MNYRNHGYRNRCYDNLTIIHSDGGFNNQPFEKREYRTRNTDF